MLTTVICDLLWNWCNYLVPSLIFAIITTGLFWCVRTIGWREAVRGFWQHIKSETYWQYRFLFFMYSYFILDRTLLSRHFAWTNGMKHVLTGGWGFYAVDTGEFTLEAIENFMFFVPLMILFFVAFFPDIRFMKCIKKSLSIGIFLSLFIEMNQLFFKIGEFQVADLVYNTAGALFGGLIYWTIVTVKKLLKVRFGIVRK